MQVSAWSNGRKCYGIRVGIANRREYFDPVWQDIVVVIDGQPHVFKLTPGFWKSCPEFRDQGKPVIREWLASQNKLHWVRGHPPRFQLAATGANRFELVAPADG